MCHRTDFYTVLTYLDLVTLVIANVEFAKVDEPRDSGLCVQCIDNLHSLWFR
jgi:hypothetical protein